jgi:hypothetical protein
MPMSGNEPVGGIYHGSHHRSIEQCSDDRPWEDARLQCRRDSPPTCTLLGVHPLQGSGALLGRQTEVAQIQGLPGLNPRPRANPAAGKAGAAPTKAAIPVKNKDRSHPAVIPRSAMKEQSASVSTKMPLPIGRIQS